MLIYSTIVQYNTSINPEMNIMIGSYMIQFYLYRTSMAEYWIVIVGSTIGTGIFTKIGWDLLK